MRSDSVLKKGQNEDSNPFFISFAAFSLEKYLLTISYYLRSWDDASIGMLLEGFFLYLPSPFSLSFFYISSPLFWLNIVNDRSRPVCVMTCMLLAVKNQRRCMASGPLS